MQWLPLYMTGQAVLPLPCVTVCVGCGCASVSACMRRLRVVCVASVSVRVLRACKHACLWEGWVGCRGMGYGDVGVFVSNYVRA